jgi:glycosyltransferase involved in cell wall biosynthesis
MNSLTLSIVIPAYNEESYLKSCLSAIAEQSVTPDEVIVVDNNSTDKTAQIALSFPFVKLVQETRQGLYFSRQTGMDSASSDIIARIDADTIIDRHWVEAIKTTFLDKTVQGLTGPVGYHDMPLPDFTQKAEDICLRMARVGQYDFMMGANMALRKSVWELIKDELCNEPFLFEDIDIVIHMSEHDIRPDYQPAMSAKVSSRRFADKPSDFMRYIGGHTRTHEHHNKQTPLGVHFAEGIFALVYLGVKPFHMVFDPALRRPSLTYLLSRTTPRPDPMTTK